VGRDDRCRSDRIPDGDDRIPDGGDRIPDDRGLQCSDSDTADSWIDRLLTAAPADELLH
jgi:hypothetical protein